MKQTCPCMPCISHARNAHTCLPLPASKRYEAEMESTQRELHEAERQINVLRNQPPPMAGPSDEKYDADVNEQRKAKARAQVRPDA